MAYHNIICKVLENKKCDKQAIENCAKSFIRMYNKDIFREDIEITVLSLLLSYVIESDEFYNKNINDLLFIAEDLLSESDNRNDLIYKINHLSQNSIAKEYLDVFLLGSDKTADRIVRNVIKYLKQENKKIENLQRLEVIEMLDDNWNGNEATSFSKELISKVENLILNLKVQPDIFPTAADSIQLEYDLDDNMYIEFEISENKDIDVFLIDEDITENFYRINCTPEAIWRELKNFLEE